MDIDEKIHIELLKRLKVFSETYVSSNSHKNSKKNYHDSPIIYPKTTLFQKFSLNDNKKLSMFSNINSKNKLNSINSQLKNDEETRSCEKNDSRKKHKKRFSPDLKKIKKMSLKNNNVNKSKYNLLKKIKSINNFYGENQDNKKDRYKAQDEEIKINLVNQKFKIANDFNEKNSNQFLKEKDECLKKIILTDEIEEEELIPFYTRNEKEIICELSYIIKNEYSNKDDTVEFLSELIKDLK